MGKKLNIIEINGKRYDAHSGAALDHSQHSQHPRPITVQHAKPAAKPAPAHKPHHAHAARKPAKAATVHKQQRSATLMRQAVRKPSASLKRRIKVQGHTGILAEQPVTEIAPKLSFGAANNRRLEHASRIKKSNLIKHFNLNASASDNQIKVTVNRPPASAATPKPRLPKAVPRQSAPDIDAIFERAIQHATSHLEPAPQATKKRHFHLRRKHARA